MRKLLFIFLLFFSSKIFAVPEQSYQIKDLQTLDYNSSEAKSINNSGQVLGVIQLNQNSSQNGVFLWDPYSGLFKLEIPLNTIEEQVLLNLKTKNNTKLFSTLEVVKLTNNGSALINCKTLVYNPSFSHEIYTPIIWTKDGGSEIIEVPGLENLQILDGNDYDQILLSNGEQKLVLNGKTERYIGVIDKPAKINNNGEVLGQIKIKNKNKIFYILAVLKPNGDILKVPIKNSADPVAFNDSGEIVGRILPDGERYKYFVWNMHKNFIDFKEKLQLIINDENAVCDVFIQSILGINNKGDLLCTYTKNWYEYSCYGVISNEKLIDINSILNLDCDVSNQWTRAQNLTDFNDQGQMIGTGQIAGFQNEHGFIIKKEL